MTIRNLDILFSPRSVAFFGASPRAGSVGKTIMSNLLEGYFDGPVWLVNPKYGDIAGTPCYKDIGDLPGVPDLAVIATPPETVPGIISTLGAAGTKGAVIITAGLRENGLTQPMLDATKPHCLRTIGPNCMGIMVPQIGLNASFAHAAPHKGDIAFLSQSGAVISAVLDWAAGEGIGFSHVVSMGEMADVDLGDMLDYLAGDPGTRVILMYLEQVTDARKFMSAARSAARVKPVVAIKSGRHEAAAKAAHSHTGALAGADAAYQAAFHRAGILRVTELEDLFDAAEALSRLKPLAGDRLAIVTNGGGAGVLAVDRLIDFRGTLAALSDDTVALLNKVLPPTWSHANPVDIIGDAGPERYRGALDAVLEDPQSDAVLVINCPTALASSTEAAHATIDSIRRHNKSTEHPKAVLTAWLGNAAVAEAHKLLAENGYPSYETPEDAVRGFAYLTRYAKDQKALMQTPPSLPEDFTTDPEKAREIIHAAIEHGRTVLTEPEAKAVMKAYGIPTVDTAIVQNPDEAERIAAEMFGKDIKEIALKILSGDITHKSDVGGVALGLPNAKAVRQAAIDMLARVQDVRPDAVIEGFTVQPMIRRTGAHELIIGASEDKTFGPPILFGAGGTAVEVIKDTAMALPPLDIKLAYDLMDETKIYRLLQGYRDRPPADMDAIALTLVRVSQMIADLAEITELDINPLLADEKGVIALDARMAVKAVSGKPAFLNPRFAIRPYPKQWETRVDIADGKTVILRPIRPEDEHYYDMFMQKTSPEDIRLRLFSPLQRLSHTFIARLTQIDYARAMAFIAIDPDSDEMLGVSRLASDPDYVRAEYGVITRSDMKGKGLGWALMQQLIRYAEAEGIGEIWGQVMAENVTMLKMCRELGFRIEKDPHDPSLKLVTRALKQNVVPPTACAEQGLDQIP